MKKFLLVILCLTAVFCIIALIVTQKKTTAKFQTPENSLVPDSSILTNKEEVSGSEYLSDRGTLRGYYIMVNSSDLVVGDIICDAFDVVGGSKSLIDSYSQTVREGNTINMLSESGDLIVTLGRHYDLERNDFPDDFFGSYENYQKLIQSSPENPVTIEIELPKPTYKSGSCGSSVSKIVRVF